jgi:hypothetical protein
MWRKKGHQKTPYPAAFTAVGDECEAYLAGQLAFYLQDTGRTVPPVAWLNQVVHGTAAELSLLAVERSDVIGLVAWRKALGYLSRILFERARATGRPIGELQELLVPLELELFGDPDAVLLDADDVVRLALARLYELPELSA